MYFHNPLFGIETQNTANNNINSKHPPSDAIKNNKVVMYNKVDHFKTNK